VEPGVPINPRHSQKTREYVMTQIEKAEKVLKKMKNTLVIV